MAADPFLHGVLTEAGITGTAYDQLVQAFPTLDALYDARLVDIERICGDELAASIRQTLGTRSHFDAAGTDPSNAPSGPEMQAMLDEPLDGEAVTLRDAMRIRSAADQAIRAARIKREQREDN